MTAWKVETNHDDMRTVLIISRDSEMVTIWETLFQQKKCHVVSETSEGNALQTSNLLSPALIILDLNLPQSERIGLCRKLRSTTNGTLLLLAPKEDGQEILEYHRAGVDEHLSTPINPMALLIKSMAWMVRQEYFSHQ